MIEEINAMEDSTVFMVEWGLGRRIEEKLSYVIFSSTTKIKNRRGLKFSETMNSLGDPPNGICRKISVERFDHLC